MAAGRGGVVRKGQSSAGQEETSAVVHFEPITGTVLRWRLVGRRLLGSGSPPAAPKDVDPQGATFFERVRKEIAKHGSPPNVKKRLVCRKGHTLIWLVESPWGCVPVAKGATARGISVRSSDGLQSPPMALDKWPAGEHLPLASCPCYQAVEVSVHEARSWLEVPRDKFVFEPYDEGPTENI